jgi:phosphoglycolate phosphatase
MAEALVLFDIDGTLIRCGGIGRAALEEAFEAVYGWPAALEDVVCDGETDPLIMAAVGRRFGRDEIDTARVLEVYLPALARRAAALESGGPLPGVARLMERLVGDSRFRLGLVTGNVREGARIKLERFGLWDAFGFGGFGCDSAWRAELIDVALARSGLSPEVPRILFGDTPNDVRAAQARGCVSFAVCTGFRYRRKDLEDCAPKFLADDLSNTDSILELLDGLASGSLQRFADS